MWCCCAAGNGASSMSTKCSPLVLCKARWWCCCFYFAYAIPCDEHVPCELGACGLMLLEPQLASIDAKIQGCRGEVGAGLDKAGDAVHGGANKAAAQAPAADANEPANGAAGKVRTMG